MPQGLIKQLTKPGSVSLRKIAVFTCKYLKEVHDCHISPKEYYQDFADQTILHHNLALAQAYYAKQEGITDICMDEEDKPEDPKDGQYIINNDFQVEQYDKVYDNWVIITEPILPDEN